MKLVTQVKQLIPQLSKSNKKGDSGKVAVIGGSFEYTGAPYVAAITSLKIGADLSYIFCSRDAGFPIKSYGPEIIVMPYLRTEAEIKSENKQADIPDIVEKVTSWLGRGVNAVVVGPGLGRDEVMQKSIKEIIKSTMKLDIPIILDGDAIWTIENDPSLIHGYKKAILTPNVNEFKRLCKAVLKKEYESDNTTEALTSLCKALGDVTIVQKGTEDNISDGKTTIKCDLEGGLKRVGGQGDVLAGIIGTFAAWSTNAKLESSEIPPLMLACWGGCALTRTVSKRAYDNKGRSMVSTDMIEELHNSFTQLFETK